MRSTVASAAKMTRTRDLAPPSSCWAPAALPVILHSFVAMLQCVSGCHRGRHQQMTPAHGDEGHWAHPQSVVAGPESEGDSST